jgi:hypothetical protein
MRAVSGAGVANLREQRAVRQFDTPVVSATDFCSRSTAMFETVNQEVG